MKVVIRDVEQDIPVQTVSLGKNIINPSTTHLFHCIYCTKGILQVQGRVDKIFPGLEPTLDVVAMIKCMDCHRLYTFQSHKYKDAKLTRVVLAQVEGIANLFNCYVCRTPLAEFRNKTLQPYPLLSPVELPHMLTCSKSSCLRRYSVVDIL